MVEMVIKKTFRNFVTNQLPTIYLQAHDSRWSFWDSYHSIFNLIASWHVLVWFSIVHNYGHTNAICELQSEMDFRYVQIRLGVGCASQLSSAYEQTFFAITGKNIFKLDSNPVKMRRGAVRTHLTIKFLVVL